MIERLNIVSFEYINNFAGVSPILDNFAIIIAEYLLFVFILWLGYLWFKKNKEYKSIALYSVYSAILGRLLNFLIAAFYYHPRPFMVHIGKVLIQHAADTSFPSDHTTFMLSTAFMLIYFKETRLSGILLSLFGFAGGLARVFCGIHFPMDLIGALGVALISSFIIHLSQSKLEILNRAIINSYFKRFKQEKTEKFL